VESSDELASASTLAMLARVASSGVSTEPVAIVRLCTPGTCFAPSMRPTFCRTHRMSVRMVSTAPTAAMATAPTEETIKVSVEMATGAVVPITVPRLASLAELKLALGRRAGWPFSWQQLLRSHAWEVIDDDLKTLGDLSIVDGSVLRLIPAEVNPRLTLDAAVLATIPPRGGAGPPGGMPITVRLDKNVVWRGKDTGESVQLYRRAGSVLRSLPLRRVSFAESQLTIEPKDILEPWQTYLLRLRSEAFLRVDPMRFEETPAAGPRGTPQSRGFHRDCFMDLRTHGYPLSVVVTLPKCDKSERNSKRVDFPKGCKSIADFRRRVVAAMLPFFREERAKFLRRPKPVLPSQATKPGRRPTVSSKAASQRAAVEAALAESATKNMAKPPVAPRRRRSSSSSSGSSSSEEDTNPIPYHERPPLSTRRDSFDDATVASAAEMHLAASDAMALRRGDDRASESKTHVSRESILRSAAREDPSAFVAPPCPTPGPVPPPRAFHLYRVSGDSQVNVGSDMDVQRLREGDTIRVYPPTVYALALGWEDME
jgi:hypothetical protein